MNFTSQISFVWLLSLKREFIISFLLYNTLFDLKSTSNIEVLSEKNNFELFLVERSK